MARKPTPWSNIDLAKPEIGSLEISRDSLTEERVDAIRAEAEKLGLMHILTREEREANRKAVLADRLGREDVWVFGYGSLIWNPAFNYVEKRAGRIFGRHRKFCLSTPMGRGTPDCPGLVLGLERGGSCWGVAFRIAADEVDSETEIVWRREMISGAYEPRFLDCETEQGLIEVIAFVINPLHERYIGHLDIDATARIIATAAGTLGHCSEYLENTCAHLEELGLADRHLKQLRERVREFQNSG
jgi:cation transport protein ChaC